MARLTFLLLLLWVGVAVSTVVDLQKRIIGGTPCDRPYHVRLRIVMTDGKCDLCGGSLISERWILTAAHCLNPGEFIFAVLGAGAAAQTVQITANPVKYTDNNNREHDLMLLQLPGNSGIPPVPLPDCRNQPRISQTVEIQGHAAIQGGPNNERRPREVPDLHCADIPVDDCTNLRHHLQTNFPKLYQRYVYQDWFCGQSPTVDACKGDSGGGVVFNGQIYGVIAFTGDPHYVCSKAVAFMNLCNQKYSKWIKDTIKKPKK